MQTIRKRLSILFVICSFLAILLITLFVNVTINNRFDEYMMQSQNKLYDRIVNHFQEIYKKEGKWSEDSGIELVHEAYMGNYCLTILDVNEKVVWGMDSKNILENKYFGTMEVKNSGIYESHRFEIKVDEKIVGYVDIGQYSSILLTEEDINFKTSINRSILASGVITLIIIIIISLYFSNQFSTPIKEVANMSVSLSKGEYDTKSHTVSNIEELENLRRSVNVLAEKLKHQDELRKRLVSDISHEIRTPLNVLQNNLEAMIDGVFPVTTEKLNYLNDEVVRFGKLLNNLNVLKEFEEEGIKLNFEKINMNELIQSIFTEFKREAESKNIDLSYKDDKQEHYISGDRDRLKQVFINLLSNAVKFTEEKGLVLVSLYEQNKNVVIEVKDNGIGIKKEDLSFIFERLYRGDKSRHQIEGNGLGLTIVKNILSFHNANMEVESKEGEGSVFKVYFKKDYNIID